MLIEQTRILSVEKHFDFLSEDTEFILGVRIDDNLKINFSEIGFINEPKNGDTVLPPTSFGAVSRFNAEGKYIKHKDQEMETAYRQIEWHWKEFCGRNERVERSKIVDVPYKRYPRTYISPPSMEISFIYNNEVKIIKINKIFKYTSNNFDDIKHGVNLLLEIFNRCEVFTKDLDIINKPSVRRLNWDILPKGKYPWDKLQPKLDEIIKREPKGNHPVINNRFEKIRQYDPEFTAIGRAGFRGYVIFGFPKKELYILESTKYGNATYVLSENWEKLSKLTKAELLQNDLHKDRIIHRESWENEIDKLLA